MVNLRHIGQYIKLKTRNIIGKTTKKTSSTWCWQWSNIVMILSSNCQIWQWYHRQIVKYDNDIIVKLSNMTIDIIVKLSNMIFDLSWAPLSDNPLFAFASACICICICICICVWICICICISWAPLSDNPLCAFASACFPLPTAFSPSRSIRIKLDWIWNKLGLN